MQTKLLLGQVHHHHIFMWLVTDGKKKNPTVIVGFFWYDKKGFSLSWRNVF